MPNHSNSCSQLSSVKVLLTDYINISRLGIVFSFHQQMYMFCFVNNASQACTIYIQCKWRVILPWTFPKLFTVPLKEHHHINVLAINIIYLFSIGRLVSIMSLKCFGVTFTLNILTAVDHNKVNLISYKALFIYYHNMLVKYQNQKIFVVSTGCVYNFVCNK